MAVSRLDSAVDPQYLCFDCNADQSCGRLALVGLRSETSLATSRRILHTTEASPLGSRRHPCWPVPRRQFLVQFRVLFLQGFNDLNDLRIECRLRHYPLQIVAERAATRRVVLAVMAGWVDSIYSVDVNIAPPIALYDMGQPPTIDAPPEYQLLNLLSTQRAPPSVPLGLLQVCQGNIHGYFFRWLRCKTAAAPSIALNQGLRSDRKFSVFSGLWVNAADKPLGTRSRAVWPKRLKITEDATGEIDSEAVG